MQRDLVIHDGATGDAAIRDVVIREIGADEFAKIWPIFGEVLARGESYNYPPDLSMQRAQAMWTSPPYRSFIAESDAGEALGCYKLGPNQLGRGDHVANASYMVAERAWGRGIGGALCEHSLIQAREAGFLAMQFNYVVSSNTAAVHLWQKHGFAIVGRVPGAFRHDTLGLVDVLVMHRAL
ncbi:GNAT family N-acetyltransferase [Lysobacter capsici]|uniref:GNAT family N-acetyltransferase n=1 Tax=Lysobacter capsici TaxID=435897 RepID=UPI000BBAA682|nr:GNAT family N-acetyltransferase [Lysobacter capsici]ATE71173.1 GNAT family N-acetyltransferase [Lysobacter capsici]